MKKKLIGAAGTLLERSTEHDLLQRLVPKGTLYSELLALPRFWWEVSKVELQNMQEMRYDYGAHSRQYLLLFQPPPHATHRQQIVIYFHGGGWRFGKPEQFRANAQLLVNQGYTVIMPSYRRIPRYNYWHIREDLTAILQKIRWIQQQQAMLDYDLILGGLSAGGNLAALMYYNQAELRKAGFSPQEFNGLFFLGAPLDLHQMRNSLVLQAYAGNRKKNRFYQANPINYLDEVEQPSVLCIHSNKDGLVEYECAISYVETMQQLHPEQVEFHTLTDATHLDTARWSYKDEQVRKLLFNWLAERN